MSYTPYNAPLLSGLLGDLEVAAHFSVKSDIEAALKFEAALARAQTKLDIIPESAASEISSVSPEFEPDIRAISSSMQRDGVFIPEFLRQLRSLLSSSASEFIHYGATSQDVIDTSLILRLKSVNTLLSERLSRLLSLLCELEGKFGSRTLVGRTRMQAALPIAVSDRLSVWQYSLQSCADGYSAIKSEVEVVQFAGAVGTLHKFGSQGAKLRKQLAEELDLHDPLCSWHADRSRIVDYANWLSKLSGALGKIGQDIALMAQNEFGDIKLSGGGGSSAMPHKQNPVKAEALVTLARFNATQVPALHHSLIHEQERSGAAWMLEWMVLPQMCVAAGAALNNAQALLASVEQMGGH